MKLGQLNKYLVRTVDIDGLVHLYQVNSLRLSGAYVHQ